MRAVLYVWITGADLGATADDKFPELRRYAESRGWSVAAEVHDATALVRSPKRPGAERLETLISSREVDVVVTESLAGLFRDPQQMAKCGERWSAAGIGIVALQDAIDTTEGVDRLRLAAASSMLSGFLTGRHRRAVILGQLRSSVGVGRPEAIVNPLEIRQLWEAGLSNRQICAAVRARGGRISEGTLAKAVERMRSLGQLDETVRGRALSKHGGLPRGGRPAIYDRIPRHELAAAAESGERPSAVVARLRSAGMKISLDSFYHQRRAAIAAGHL